MNKWSGATSPRRFKGNEDDLSGWVVRSPFFPKGGQEVHYSYWYGPAGGWGTHYGPLWEKDHRDGTWHGSYSMRVWRTKQEALAAVRSVYGNSRWPEVIRLSQAVEEDPRPVRFTLSGTAYTIAAEGNWPNDNPRGWATLSRSPERKVGKGVQRQVDMRRDDALDLAFYIESVAEVWACMTAEERGGDRPEPLFVAVKRIFEAAQYRPQ